MREEGHVAQKDKMGTHKNVVKEREVKTLLGH
jgi:hypothetical protein